MTELSLYTFLDGIVSVIPAVAGRFAVLENGGNDLNADNSDDVNIANAINQSAWKKKYPCAVLMPPREIGRNKNKNTTRYELVMFFLTTTYTSGSGAIKSANIQTNTSKTAIKDDWAQMRTAAEDFMSTMQCQFYADISILEYIRPVKSSPEEYERVSLMNNDRLSGARVRFELDVVLSCSTSEGVPSFAIPTDSNCCVKSGGTVGQVYTKISDDYNDAEWQDPTGGTGGAPSWVDVTVGDASIEAEDNTRYYLPAGVLTADRTVDVSAITTRVMLIIEEDAGVHTLSFTGATVYRKGGSEAFTQIDGQWATTIEAVTVATFLGTVTKLIQTA